MPGRAQYPGEKEITFPPFTCLESDGDPRVERNAQGEIVFFPLKAIPPTSSCLHNPSCLYTPSRIKRVARLSMHSEALLAHSLWGRLCLWFACAGRMGVRGLQASVNPKAETVEELQRRRKHLHMGMLKLAKEDLSLALQAAYNAHLVKPPPPHKRSIFHTVISNGHQNPTNFLPTETAPHRPPSYWRCVLMAACAAACGDVG